jgi:rhodanese-related sulfurtransferase
VCEETRRILLEAAIIFFLGAVIGLSFNFRLVMNAFSGTGGVSEVSVNPVTGAESRYPVPVDLQTIRELAGEGVVLVDARPAELYAQGHLPDARSLPLGEVDARIGDFRRQYPPSTTLVTYCSGYGCTDSFDLAERLLREGYRDVRVFEGGFPEWRDTGLPVAKGAP